MPFVGRSFAVVASVLSLACASGDGHVAASAPATTPRPRAAPLRPAAAAVPGEYLVTLAPGAGEALIEERFGTFGIRLVRSLGRSVFLVRFEPDPGLDALEEARLGDGRVVALQPNYAYGATSP